MDRLQLLVLLATFFGAAVIVVAAYAVFCLIASISEGDLNLTLTIMEQTDKTLCFDGGNLQKKLDLPDAILKLR